MASVSLRAGLRFPEPDWSDRDGAAIVGPGSENVTSFEIVESHGAFGDERVVLDAATLGSTPLGMSIAKTRGLDLIHATTSSGTPGRKPPPKRPSITRSAATGAPIGSMPIPTARAPS